MSYLFISTIMLNIGVNSQIICKLTLTKTELELKIFKVQTHYKIASKYSIVAQMLSEGWLMLLTRC